MEEALAEAAAVAQAGRLIHIRPAARFLGGSLMRSALVLLPCVGWICGSALAQTPAPALSGQALTAQSHAPTSAWAKATRKAKKGRARRRLVADKRPEPKATARSDDDTLTSCLELWEPATHMSRRQWARACRRVAERLKDTKVQ
jgi:hypothetical protein